VFIASTEEYNGSTWTAGGNVNTARQYACSAGIQTAALAFGGESPAFSPTIISVAEEYDGTSWTNITSLPAVKELGGGAGTTSAGLSFAGRNTTVNLATTEEWTGAGPVTKNNNGKLIWQNI
jgi:hypothetical protein